MAVMSWSPFLASAAGPFFSFTMVKMCRTTEVRVVPAVLQVYDDDEGQVFNVHEGDRDHVDHVADALRPNVFLFCACVIEILATFQNRKSLERKSGGRQRNCSGPSCLSFPSIVRTRQSWESFPSISSADILHILCTCQEKRQKEAAAAFPRFRPPWSSVRACRAPPVWCGGRPTAHCWRTRSEPG